MDKNYSKEDNSPKVEVEEDYAEFLLQAGKYMLDKGEFPRIKYEELQQASEIVLNGVTELLIPLRNYRIIKIKIEGVTTFQLLKTNINLEGVR